MLGHLVALATLLALTPHVVQCDALHRVRHVTIAPSVQLEVLDWGGSGPAMVFLAGFGNTGHVFDGFAPRFTNRYHVLAITRRGFGASSRPNTGYDTRTLAADIVSVLDSLGLRRATFVGHSFAGSELSYLAAGHAERVGQLVYLDASYDFARLYADSVWRQAFPVPRPAPPATKDIVQWRRWFALVMGPSLPDDEIRALTTDASAGALSDSLQRGAASVNLSDIHTPMLALWATPRSVAEQYPYWASLTATERERLRASFTAQQLVRRAHLDQFRRQVPGALLVPVPAGRHHLFLSHPQLVADAMRGFLRSQHPQPNER